MGILTALMGSQIGRDLALVGLGILAVLAAVWAVFRSGEKAAQSQQASASLSALRQRISDEDSIHTLSPDARRQQLQQWAGK